jgi:hypothetical protein
MSPLARVALLWIESSFREDFASAQALYDGVSRVYPTSALVSTLCCFCAVCVFAWLCVTHPSAVICSWSIYVVTCTAAPVVCRWR